MLKLIIYPLFIFLIITSCKHRNEEVYFSIQDPNVRNALRKDVDEKREIIKNNIKELSLSTFKRNENLIEYEEKLENLYINNPNTKRILFMDWFRKSAIDISTLSKFNELQTLDLSSKWNNELPDNFSDLVNLDSLKLSMDNLITLPNALSFLKDLKYLHIDCKNLETFDKKSLNLPSLRTLIISDISENLKLSNELDSLDQLECLSFRGISNVPASIASMKKIEYLELNGVEVIPKEIEKIDQLKVLEITDCGSVIALNEFENLVSLKITNSDIDNLHFTNRMKSLKFLHLSDLDSIPKGIGELSNLQFLILERVNLGHLYGDIVNASEICHIALRNCHNADSLSLPSFFKDFPSLVELDLYSNKLESIPEDIFHSKSLRLINFSSEKRLNIPDNYLKRDNIFFTNSVNNGFEYNNGKRDLNSY